MTEETYFPIYKNLYNVVEKYTICIRFPPSAGKLFFSIQYMYLFSNSDIFGTANKTNNFTWADSSGGHLVMWNEPNNIQRHV